MLLILVSVVLPALEEKGWIERLCSVARQFTDDYIRVVFLIILDMLCSCNRLLICWLIAPTCCPILVNNIDIILLSVEDSKEFTPLDSSYSRDNGESEILKCFEVSWNADTRSHIPQERVFQILSSLALKSCDCFLIVIYRRRSFHEGWNSVRWSCNTLASRSKANDSFYLWVLQVDDCRNPAFWYDKRRMCNG